MSSQRWEADARTHLVSTILSPFGEALRATIALQLPLRLRRGWRSGSRLVRPHSHRDRRHAGEEENDKRRAQEGRSPPPGFGLDRLSARERAEVEHQVAEANRDFQEAIRVGVVKADTKGVFYYVPRIILAMDKDGKFVRPKSGERVAGMEGIGRGFTTTTPQMKHRKYDTSAETEAAAKKHFGESAKIVKDIVALPLATAKLREAIAGRTLINQIKALGDLAGRNTVRVGGEEEPGWLWDDKEVERDAPLKGIMRWVRLHPYNISQKVQIVVEHFRENIVPLSRRSCESDDRAWKSRRGPSDGSSLSTNTSDRNRQL